MELKNGDIIHVLIKQYVNHDNWLPVQIIEQKDQQYFIPFNIIQYTPLPVILLDYFVLDYFGEDNPRDHKYIQDSLKRRSAKANEKNWKKLTDFWNAITIPTEIILLATEGKSL